MRLSNDRIGLKLVRPSEFKWTGTHSTQVHMPQNYIKDWKKETTLDGILVIQDHGIERVSAYSLPTDGKWNDKPPRSPRIRKTPFKDSNGNITGKYPSLWTVAHKAGEKIKKLYDVDQILLITCTNEQRENIFLLLRLEDTVLEKIKNNTDIKIPNEIHKTISCVLFKGDKSYEYIKLLAETYYDMIQLDAHAKIDEILLNDNFWDPKNIEDSRKKIKTLITIRQGQSKFRKDLFNNYGGKCCITKCDVVDTLEACHIYPYMGKETNHVSNGLLLRSDLHLLYDNGKICINENYQVILSETLKDSHWYKKFHKTPITKPFKTYPSKEAIKYKLKEFKG
jgi:hypothetical protein